MGDWSFVPLENPALISSFREINTSKHARICDKQKKLETTPSGISSDPRTPIRYRPKRAIGSVLTTFADSARKRAGAGSMDLSIPYRNYALPRQRIEGETASSTTGAAAHQGGLGKKKTERKPCCVALRCVTLPCTALRWIAWVLFCCCFVCKLGARAFSLSVNSD